MIIFSAKKTPSNANIKKLRRDKGLCLRKDIKIVIQICSLQLYANETIFPLFILKNEERRNVKTAADRVKS